MHTSIIQRQVPIGSHGTFSRKDGREIAGVLVEIGRDHITIEQVHNHRLVTLSLEMVTGWEIHEEKKSTSTEQEALRKLIEVEARFQAQLQTSKIEIIPPNFAVSQEELRGPYQKKATEICARIKNRFEYAVKINELSGKFGRIQPIIHDLESLTQWFPTSPSIKRQLAHLYLLSGSLRKSVQCYKDAAVASQTRDDWYNVAAIALEEHSEELVCYGLEQYYNHARATDDLNAWHVFIRFVHKFSNYSALSDYLKAPQRTFSQSEENLVWETALYLLQATKKDRTATEFVQRWLRGESPKEIAFEAFQKLNSSNSPSDSYQRTVSELSVSEKTRTESNPQTPIPQPQGYLLRYSPDRSYGFLKGEDGTSYFFHRSAVTDEETLEKLESRRLERQTPLVFEAARSEKGPLAVQVSLHRTPDEMFSLALKFADDGEYPKAIAQIRKILSFNSNYPQAQNYHKKWREYARATTVPRGTNPFARAKRAQLVEKDLERAVQLFETAIKQGDNVESAIKDRSALLLQLGRTPEAISFLQQNRKKISDQKSADNVLVTLYQNAGQYDDAIVLLRDRLKRERIGTKSAQIIGQIAHCYLRKKDFVRAEQEYRGVLKLQPEHTAARRNVAYCLFEQERFDEAEKLLNRILDSSPDGKSAELLSAIGQAKKTGRTKQILFETNLSAFSTDITEFAQFFLKRCDFQGVPPDRAQKGQFDRSDIHKLEGLATKLGTRRPRDRSGYYLSAARIVSDLEEEDPNFFYRYFYRSLASMGDAVVVENRPLDTAQELYVEALAVYDGDRSRRRNEADAVNALVRYIYATMGHSYVPIRPEIPTIDETIEHVLQHHPQRDRVFEAISYLVSRSRYAAERILNRLYSKSTLQVMSLEFLKGRGISPSQPIKKLESFIALWNERRRKKFDEFRAISDEFRFLRRFDFTTGTLEDGIERARLLKQRLFYDLDRQRTEHLQQILEMTLDLCKQGTFEEQERLCLQIKGRCQDLRQQIENNPTKLTVEEIDPIAREIEPKVDERLEELYQGAAPQLTLRLPMESYTPNSNQQLEVQIVVANRMGCSPAESLELVFQEDDDRFELTESEIKLAGSLRGGDREILRVPLRVSEKEIRSQAFSLPVYAQYRTRSGDTTQTPVQNFSIRLSSDAEFERIDNPYASYAEGGIVGAPEMFYGRRALIETVAGTIQDTHVQSKSIVIFGQKRAGKSSILHHLKQELIASNNLLILDLGNIGSILDEHSQISFTYQILWSILDSLNDAISEKVTDGFGALSLAFPTAIEFFQHPSPQVAFKEIFNRYRRQAVRAEGWSEVQIVLLIDEFSYIHDQIVRGRIPELFMKTWKALLQENYFNAVLVGQDVMPKFKQRFPNEFGTTQDERVTYLREEDARKLIDEPIRIGGWQGESRYRERAIERILALSAGSPFYIQIICNRLVEYMNRKRASLVTDSDVEQVKEELIRDVNALGPDKFDNLINSGDTSEDAISDEDTRQVLTSIAVNSRTSPCNRNSIVCETHTPVETILEDLVQRDVIERERGQYYRIRVGLFKEWLAAHAR